MSDVTTEFVEQLARNFGDAGVLLDQHRAYYHEVLPHVYFGDPTRYVLSEGHFCEQIVEHLNHHLQFGLPEIQELIAVSFVENLETEEELNRACRFVDGSCLRQEWRRQHANLPGQRDSAES